MQLENKKGESKYFLHQLNFIDDDNEIRAPEINQGLMNFIVNAECIIKVYLFNH